MTKKEYIFKMSNLIKNRVIYHSPLNFEDIDFQKIKDKGINLNYPIFIMEKPIKKELLEAFVLAEKEVSFNLILREKNKKIQKKIKNCFVVRQSEIPSLDKLNINYKSFAKLYKVENEEYIKINGKEQNFEQKLFYHESKNMIDNVFYSLKKYILNGLNVQIEMINSSNEEKKLEFEYNFPMKRGYYSFEELDSGLKIINFLTNDEIYFNTSFGKNPNHFSCIDGLENSTFSRINYKNFIILKSYERKIFLINIGNQKMKLRENSKINEYFLLSQYKNFECFNIKIDSNDKDFERRFNRILPNKIWNSWLNGERDYQSETEYLEYKNNLLIKDGNRFILGKNRDKINDIFVFNGRDYNKIAIHS